jgi:hypothetical protein
MAKPKSKTHKLVDAFRSASAARAAARDLNNAPAHASCPGGPNARVKITGKGGDLKYGVYVRKSCRIY